MPAYEGGNMTDHIKLRTDVVLSTIMGLDPPVAEYLKSLDGKELVKEDMAAMAMAEEPPVYSMRDLGSPLPPSQMVIPSDYQSYLAGHSKIGTSPMKDWPMADEDNHYGEHHPFGMNSNCCPLLHNAAHGEPQYVDDIFDFINLMGEAHKQGERGMKLSPEDAKIFGDPKMSMLDLYERDRNRGYGAEENWESDKRQYLANEFGLLPFLFGLEWHQPEEGERFYGLLKDLSQTESPESPEARTILNKFQEKTGTHWNRYLRNWRDRFTPMSAWWQRPSDRSGPTSSAPEEVPNASLTSPFIGDEPGHNFHWWEPYQYHGGVGRDASSLKGIFNQTYPEVFGENWLADLLFDGVPIDGPHMLAGSHFPASANATPEYASALSSISSGDVDFERGRSSWTSAAMRHNNHPSEVGGTGGRMVIPTEAMLLSNFGDKLMDVAELGSARLGVLRRPHPNSNQTYHDLHNQHGVDSDSALASVVAQLSGQVKQQFGADVIAPIAGDPMMNTIARGNIGQIVAAANHLLMRKEGVHGSEYQVPDTSSGQLAEGLGSFGPVSPSSQSVIAPMFNNGATDSWGHEMPATLTYKWDRNTNGLVWDMKETPFNILQRTPHELLVSAADINHNERQIGPKTKEINALSPKVTGEAALNTDINKSDDYEPTGVFKTKIEPAHVVKDLDDIDDLKGFSGDWVVQKKPKGERVFVKKSGKSIDPMSLPSKVKKSLKDSIQGDAMFDGYVDGDVLTVVDLLIHKDTDMSQEPLSDRVDALRTLYSSTDNLHFPSPNSCVNTDEGGLIKTIANFDRTDLLIRDSKSTFMKGKDVHPKWVLYAQDDITKSAILPPLPEMSIRDSNIILEYPSIYTPVIVKIDSDENGVYVDEYEGPNYLIKQAKSQFPLWSPVAALYVGMPNQAIPSYRKRPMFRKSLDKAPAVITEEEFDDDDSISNIMRHARKTITSEEVALTSKHLIAHVDGLTQSLLDKYAGEYGLEQTEDKKWTVNEAIDDDIAEKFAFPRMNQASSDGGAWSGMQADITAPTGPTEITEEENTTFGNPKKDGVEIDPTSSFRPMNMVVSTEDGDATLTINEGKAVIRFPGKDKDHDEEENEVLPALRHDDAL
jgi:hypothetical protein